MDNGTKVEVQVGMMGAYLEYLRDSAYVATVRGASDKINEKESKDGRQ